MDTWLIFVAICVLLLCLAVTVFVLIVYSGTLESIAVKVGRPPIGKVVIAYKFACGPCSGAGPLFFEVATIAPDHRALAIYYNDIYKTASQDQQYTVACILAEGEEEVDKELVKKFEEEGFKLTTLPQVAYAVYSSFPYKSALSIFIGMQKIFPKMSEVIEEKGLQAYPFLEIYSGNTIHYMSPLDCQDEFHVPESLKRPSGDEPYESTPSTEEGDLRISEGGKDWPETETHLHPSQIVRAEVIGSVAAEGEKMAEEEVEEKTAEEEVEEKTAEAVEKKTAEEEVEGREDSPQLDSPCLGEETKKERGSDEESGSSFEELKMEGEEVCEKSQ
ncbi:hypothetical protein ACOMHN_004823 [Nucella lapillus]